MSADVADSANAAISRNVVARNFDLGASRYDELATIQRAVSSTLLRLVEPNVQKATSIVDLGCGTGQLLADCRTINPAAKLTGVDISSEMLKLALNNGSDVECVQANMECTGCGPESHDLVLSSSALQWADPSRAINEAFRVCAYGGDVAITCFLYSSLSTWRGVWGIENSYLPKKTDIVSAVESVGLTVVHLHSEVIVDKPTSFDAALSSVRDLGAGANRRKSKGLMSKGRFTEIRQAVNNRIDIDGYFPMEYETLYFIASKNQRPQAGET